MKSIKLLWGVTDNGIRDYFIHPNIFIRHVYCWGKWCCKSWHFLRIGEKYLFFAHYHIGWNDSCDQEDYHNFRMRRFEILGKPIKIPFFKYDVI